MRPLDVTISSGGNFGIYNAVRGAQNAGYLNRFITTIYQRHEKGIDRSKVRQIFIPELLSMGIQKVPTATSQPLSYLIRDNLFDLMARRYLVGGDIFHVSNHFGLYSMRTARQMGMKVIVERASGHPNTVHRILTEEYARYGLPYSQANRWLLDKHVQEYVEADSIAVPSEFVRRTMIEEGVPEAKLRVMRFGFEPAYFKPMPGVKTDDTFRVIFAGSVSLQKGVQYLLEAFKRLNLPNAELVFVGGSFADSQTFLPAYRGLYRQIPFVPHPRLAEVFNTGSVFVLPSLQDGFGMVVYEAAACGLPVIITENVGAHIRDGQDGFVVPIRDPDALAERLLRLYRDENLRREMGRSAWEYVQQFTWEAYHQQVIAHYQDVAGYA